MATGTYTPFVPQQYFDNSGNPLASGTLETFAAGTSNHLATYSDVNLTVQNANPMTLDASGRPQAGQIFLTPGQSYKFLIKDSGGNTIATPDNILAVPTSSTGTDVTGTAGEALTAGQVVYLSDGSGGKNAGQWYKADSSNGYSSVIPEVGMVPNSITSGGSGTIRLVGQMTGLTSLTIGARYYVGTSGAITSATPSNVRFLGVADTTSTLVLTGDPSLPPVNISMCQGRLTLTSGTPVPSTDVTAAGTLYFTPYMGNRIALYDGSNWYARTFSEISIAVPAATSQMYDVWVFDNSGTLALELLAWTNDTTRATALTTQDGVYVKTGATTRRYVGSFRTTGVANQTEDSAAKRYVWNYYNRVARDVFVMTATASWTYNTDTFRQANASATNQLDVVCGVSEDAISAQVNVVASNATAGTAVKISIGYDSTTAAATGATIAYTQIPVNSYNVLLTSMLTHQPAAGRHIYVWLERVDAAVGNTTFQGVSAGQFQSGMSGMWRS